MKTPMSRRLRTLVAGVLLALSLPLSYASDKERAWDTVDIALAATSLTLHVVDWGQTRYIARNTDLFTETNRVLGMHPSTFEVDRYFLVYGALVAAAAHAFPEYRRVILAVHIGMHGQATASNFRIGIKMSF